MVIGLIKNKLLKTRSFLHDQLDKIIRGGTLNSEIFSELEAILIQADLGVKVSGDIIKELKILKPAGKEELYSASRKVILNILNKGNQKNEIYKNPAGPTVILFLGVNGTGKTTTIAKLARKLQEGGNTVLLAACDTFRAAAIEQLEIWGKRLGIDVIRHVYKADPGAVAYDALKAAIGRKIDYLILDTAGRFHTKTDLMDELKKINRILNKYYESAPHEKILVLDANTGQNALVQAGQFNDAIGLTGIIFAKLDGTAKGGIIVNIKKELDLPIKFVGIGQELADLEVFDPVSYVDAIL